MSAKTRDELIRNLRNRAQITADQNKRWGRTGKEWAVTTEIEWQCADEIEALLARAEAAEARVQKAERREREAAAAEAKANRLREIAERRLSAAVEALEAFAGNMDRACDRTRAVRGRPEVAVLAVDWHVLMNQADGIKKDLRRAAALVAAERAEEKAR